MGPAPLFCWLLKRENAVHSAFQFLRRTKHLNESCGLRTSHGSPCNFLARGSESQAETDGSRQFTEKFCVSFEINWHNSYYNRLSLNIIQVKKKQKNSTNRVLYKNLICFTFYAPSCIKILEWAIQIFRTGTNGQIKISKLNKVFILCFIRL